MADRLDAPFPWFGGKRRVAPIVWRYFGDVPNYVEPFFGSGAMLLGRPGVDYENLPVETVNDLDGFVCNFWRACRADSDAVAEYADRPVNENDLHPVHVWLRGRRDELTRQLEGDMDYYDAKIAGLWAWGICCWIGSGWCDLNTVGPWVVRDGKLVRDSGHAGQGVNRQRPHLGGAGQGVSRQLPHLGDAGQGVNRQRPHIGGHGMGRGVHVVRDLNEWFAALANRLRRVRVCCGSWDRVCGPSPTFKHGITAVFLDPPYGEDAQRDNALYACDSLSVATDVREWCLANGDNLLLRIALCGYEGEHQMPDTWTCHEWKAAGGYAKLGDAAGKENCKRERIWFSPHCLRMDADDGGLFGEHGEA